MIKEKIAINLKPLQNLMSLRQGATCMIGCWLIAYVAETDLQAISYVSDLAAFNELSEGEYQLRIWHPRAVMAISALLQTVSITSQSTTD